MFLNALQNDFKQAKQLAVFCWFSTSIVSTFLAGFLSAAAKHLDTVDTMVKLGNIMEPYLNQKLVQLDKSYLILANIQVKG